MGIEFNLGKFANNLQKLSESFLGNTLFLTSTRSITRGGMCGPSIWGCMGGLGGGIPYTGSIFPMGGGFYTGSMYGGMMDPGLYNMGMQQAANAAEMYFQQNLAQIKASPQATRQDTKFGEELSKNMDAQKEYKFVTDKWEELNNKENPTEEEQTKVEESYIQSAKALGKSYLSYIDKQHGNADNEMTKAEFTTYFLEKIVGNTATEEEKAQIRADAEKAFENLDINGDKKITSSEMTSLIAYMDALGGKGDGKISAKEFGQAHIELTRDDNNIKDVLTDIHKNYLKE